MASTVTARAAKSLGNYVYNNRYAIASKASSLLRSVSAKKAAVTPAAAIRNTQLKSYLDRTYEKKCGVEIKQVLSGDTAAAPGTTLATLISPFQNIAQGLTDQTRTGASLEIKRLRVRLMLTGHATLMSRVRIIVIKQGQMQGAVTAVANVLDNPAVIRSFYALDNNADFKVLKDVTFEMTPLSTNDAHTFKTWYYDYKPKGCHFIKYTQANTDGTIAAMIAGNVNIKIMYEGGAVTGSFTYNAEWTDL